MEWYKMPPNPQFCTNLGFWHSVISAWCLLHQHSIAIAVFQNEPLMDHTRTSHRPTGLILKCTTDCPPNFVPLISILMHPLVVWHFLLDINYWYHNYPPLKSCPLCLSIFWSRVIWSLQKMISLPNHNTLPHLHKN